MVIAAGNAPAFSCSRSKRLTFRLRSEELPSALNAISGHLAVGHHLRPCEVSAGRPGSTGGNGRASGYCALYSCLEGRRVSLNTYAPNENWSTLVSFSLTFRF